MTAPAPIAVRMTGISKSFGGIRALDSVDFEVRAGEVHALLGGNGAGKSTILKVLNGVHVPEEGKIEVGGQSMTTHSPEASRAAGIAMNFQEMSLIPTLTVAQNVFLTREARDARGMIDDADSVRRAQAIFDMLQVEVLEDHPAVEIVASRRQGTRQPDAAATLSLRFSSARRRPGRSSALPPSAGRRRYLPSSRTARASSGNP